MPSSTMINTAAVARLAGLTGEGVREAVARGDLPAYRFGRVLRYAQADVDAWLAHCKSLAVRG